MSYAVFEEVEAAIGLLAAGKPVTREDVERLVTAGPAVAHEAPSVGAGAAGHHAAAAAQQSESEVLDRIKQLRAVAGCCETLVVFF